MNYLVKNIFIFQLLLLAFFTSSCKSELEVKLFSKTENLEDTSNTSSYIPGWITQLGDDFDTIGTLDSSLQDYCNDIATDSSGSIYCAGYTSGNLDADESGNGGGSDAFIMKLDTNGNIIWVTQLGDDFDSAGTLDSSSNDYCYSITVDDLGNVYCAGYTSGNLDADESGNGGGSDAFVMKLDTNGNIIWVTQLGDDFDSAGTLDSSSSDFCSGVTTDESGNIYCAGKTSGNLDGNETGNGGSRDAFVMKLDTNGNVLWITQLGDDFDSTGTLDSSSIDSCNSVATDIIGNIYCAGETYGNLDADESGNGGGSDAFVMKLDTSGNILWITQFGDDFDTNGILDSSKIDSCRGTATDSLGNVYCAGYTRGNLGMSQSRDLIDSSEDALVMKLDTNGNLLWATQLSNNFDTSENLDISSEDYCYSVTSDASGNIYCAGFTNGNLDTNQNGNGGSRDAFVLKLNSLGHLP